MSAAVLTLPPTPVEVLAASPMPHLRRLQVSITDQEVVITGTVPSYYLKQMAQEAVRYVIGRRRLINRVVVPVAVA